jgi:hypothetical protein
MYSAYLEQSVNSSPKDWSLIHYHVNRINVLLKSYSVNTSTELYNKRILIQQTRKCGHCFEKKYRTVTDEEGNPTKEYYETPTEIPENTLEYSEPYQDFEARMFASMETLASSQSKKRDFRCWICPKCSEPNSVEDTPTNTAQFSSTSTHGVMYDKPILTIENRSNIDELRMVWLDDCMKEVDTAMMAYQDAFFKEHGHYMDEKTDIFKHEDDKK